MNTQQVKEIIKQELPAILKEDGEMRRFVLRLSRRHFADKVETESRFDRVLDELRRDREEQSRKWDEQNRKWDEQQAEQAKKWDEQNRKWDEQRAEQAKKWDEQNRKWEEQNRKWDEQRAEQAKKWDEQQALNERILRSIEALEYKHTSTIGALGARWGLHSEASFRNALKGILEEFFDVEVLNVVEYDDAGEVFGRPDQVELDVIIKNGVLLLVEIKSSMSKSDMYTFERKVRFYEKRRGRKASRMLVISPMVDKGAQKVAKDLGIQVYSYAREVDPAVFA